MQGASESKLQRKCEILQFGFDGAACEAIGGRLFHNLGRPCDVIGRGSGVVFIRVLHETIQKLRLY